MNAGFLSLEEIDEADYGLDVPGSKNKISNKKSKSEKQKLNEVTEGSGEDIEAEPAEKVVEEKNVKAQKKKKKKKSKKKREKEKISQQEEEPTTG